MKVFIFGMNGMLGRYVYAFLKSEDFDVVGLTRKEINIATVEQSNLVSIMHSFGLKKDDVVINCAGIIKQRAGFNKIDFIKVNALFPHYMQEICAKVGAIFIHVTTDCVYSGLRGFYNEFDTHDVSDIYGVTKSLGEPQEATIIRTSIIGEELNNFCSLLEWIKFNKNKEILGFVNHIWNGITCLQLAKIYKYMIDNKFFWCGVKHITSPKFITKHDLVKLISRIYDLNIKVVPHKTEIVCDRTLASVRDEITVDVPDLKTQIIEMKNFHEVILRKGEK